MSHKIPDSEDNFERLLNWHLARLRLLALEVQEPKGPTPSSLLSADRQTLQVLVSTLEQSMAKDNSRSVKLPERDLFKYLVSGFLLSILLLTVLVLSQAKFLPDGSAALSPSELNTLIGCSGLALIALIISFYQSRSQLTGTKAKNDLEIQLLAARERERLIANYTREPLLMLSEEGFVLSASESINLVFEKRRSSLLGEPITKIFDSLSANDWTVLLSEIREAKFPRTVDIPHILNQRTRYSRWHIEWSDSFQSYFCSIKDVSAETMVEKMKEDFLRIISHDIRTPLTSINLGLELINDGQYGPLTNETKTKLKAIGTNVEILLQLANDLLEIERSEIGTLSYQLTPIQSSEIVKKATEALEVLAKSKNIELVIEGAFPLVSAKPDRLLQVFLNLLQNAIRLSPEGSQIKLVCSPSDSEVIFEVIDQGPGIPEHLRERIFHRYVQLNNSSQGTGMGLAICKAIVTAHNGTVGAKNVPGGGANFWLKLPLS